MEYCHNVEFNYGEYVAETVLDLYKIQLAADIWEILKDNEDVDGVYYLSQLNTIAEHEEFKNYLIQSGVYTTVYVDAVGC